MMLPVYTKPLPEIEIDLSRQIDLSTQFSLTEDYSGAIQEYLLGLSDYKTFNWNIPIEVYIYYIGTFSFAELPTEFYMEELQCKN